MSAKIRNRIIVFFIVLAMGSGLIVSLLTMLQPAAETGSSASSEQTSVQSETQTETEEDFSMKTARSEVTSFFNALQEGNVKEAYTHMSTDGSDVLDLQQEYADFEDSIKDQPELLKKTSRNSYAKSIANMVQAYAIVDSAVSGDEAGFTVEITAKDASGLKEPNVDDYAAKVQEYIDSHVDEINEKYDQLGEDGLQEYLSNMQLELYYADLQKAFEQAPDVVHTLIVMVRKQADGTYQIYEISRPSQS